MRIQEQIKARTIELNNARTEIARIQPVYDAAVAETEAELWLAHLKEEDFMIEIMPPRDARRAAVDAAKGKP